MRWLRKKFIYFVVLNFSLLRRHLVRLIPQNSNASESTLPVSRAFFFVINYYNFELNIF
jgi:hypothetical protein